jgi:hypothetical protein
MNKKRTFFILYSLVVFILISCDRSGNVFIVNKYPFSIVVHVEFEYQGEQFEITWDFESGYVRAVNARSSRLSYITKIRTETETRIPIAEYSPEYILSMRKAYTKKEKQPEIWLLTEKGLFMETAEIQKRFKNNKEGFDRYYNSDEAVRDLEKKLNGIDVTK